MGRGVVFAGCMAVAMLACLGGAAAIEYVVGDSRGWTVPPNNTAGYYDEWAAGKNFTGGDSLQFEWNGTHTHNVAIVSKEEYENCTKVGLKSGNHFVFTLPADANGPYYFISTVDSDCENGLKLAINVTSPTLAESPPNSSASSITIGALSMLVLVSSSIISMFKN